MDFYILILIAALCLLAGGYHLWKFRSRDKRSRVDIEIAVLGHTGAGKTSGVAQIIDKLNKKTREKIWGNWLDDKEELELRNLSSFREREEGKRSTRSIVENTVGYNNPGTLDHEDFYLRIRSRNAAGDSVSHCVEFHDLAGGNFAKMANWKTEEDRLRKKLSHADGIIFYIDARQPPQEDDRKIWQAYSNAITFCAEKTARLFSKKKYQAKNVFPVWIALTKVDKLDLAQEHQERSQLAEKLLSQCASRFHPLLEHLNVDSFVQLHTTEENHPDYNNDLKVFIPFYQKAQAVHETKQTLARRYTRRRVGLAAIFLLLFLLFLGEARDAWFFPEPTASISGEVRSGLPQIQKELQKIDNYLKRWHLAGGFWYRKKLALKRITKLQQVLQEHYAQKENIGQSLPAKEFSQELTKLGHLQEDLEKQSLKMTSLEQRLQELRENFKRRLHFLEKYLSCVRIVSQHTSWQAKEKIYFLQNLQEFQKRYQSFVKEDNKQALLSAIVHYFVKIYPHHNTLALEIHNLLVHQVVWSLYQANVEAWQKEYPKNLLPLWLWQKQLERELEQLKHEKSEQFLSKILEIAKQQQRGHWQKSVAYLKKQLQQFGEAQQELRLESIKEFMENISFLEEQVPEFVKTFLLSKSLEGLADLPVMENVAKRQDWQQRFQEPLGKFFLPSDITRQDIRNLFHHQPQQTPFSKDTLIWLQKDPSKIRPLLPSLCFYFFLDYLPDSLQYLQKVSYDSGRARLGNVVFLLENLLASLALEESFVQSWEKRKEVLKTFHQVRPITIEVISFEFQNQQGASPLDAQGEKYWKDEYVDSFALYLRLAIFHQEERISWQNFSAPEQQHQLDWAPWSQLKVTWLDDDNSIDQGEIVDDDVLVEEEKALWTSGKMEFSKQYGNGIYRAVFEIDLALPDWLENYFD